MSTTNGNPSLTPIPFASPLSRQPKPTRVERLRVWLEKQEVFFTALLACSIAALALLAAVVYGEKQLSEARRIAADQDAAQKAKDAEDTARNEERKRAEEIHQKLIDRLNQTTTDQLAVTRELKKVQDQLFQVTDTMLTNSRITPSPEFRLWMPDIRSDGENYTVEVVPHWLKPIRILNYRKRVFAPPLFQTAETLLLDGEATNALNVKVDSERKLTLTFPKKPSFVDKRWLLHLEIGYETTSGTVRFTSLAIEPDRENSRIPFRITESEEGRLDAGKFKLVNPNEQLK